MQKLKFLYNIRTQNIDDSLVFLFNYKIKKKYKNFIYLVEHKKYRKNILNVRPGVSLNPKKNSIKRDKNLNFLNQFINLNLNDGKKMTIFKQLNKMFINFSEYLSYDLKEFKKYKYYNSLIFSYNSNLEYSNLNNLIYFAIENLESIFEIKTSKNNKKLKLKTKYSHEIIYIPKERRLKYALKALSFYKEHFKNYDF